MNDSKTYEEAAAEFRQICLEIDDTSEQNNIKLSKSSKRKSKQASIQSNPSMNTPTSMTTKSTSMELDEHDDNQINEENQIMPVLKKFKTSSHFYVALLVCVPDFSESLDNVNEEFKQILQKFLIANKIFKQNNQRSRLQRYNFNEVNKTHPLSRSPINIVVAVVPPKNVSCNLLILENSLNNMNSMTALNIQSVWLNNDEFTCVGHPYRTRCSEVYLKWVRNFTIGCGLNKNK